MELTAFSARYRGRGVDLTRPPLAEDRAAWTDPTDYGPCQALADAARSVGIEVIRSESVRDPAGGRNVSLLTCAAFAAAEPEERQTWRLSLGDTGARALCEFPEARLEFPASAFSRDPRLAGVLRSA